VADPRDDAPFAWTAVDRRLSDFIDHAVKLLDDALVGSDDAVTAACRRFLEDLERLVPDEPRDP
jgi:hypothetical protein